MCVALNRPVWPCLATSHTTPVTGSVPPRKGHLTWENTRIPDEAAKNVSGRCSSAGEGPRDVLQEVPDGYLRGTALHEDGRAGGGSMVVFQNNQRARPSAAGRAQQRRSCIGVPASQLRPLRPRSRGSARGGSSGAGGGRCGAGRRGRSGRRGAGPAASAAGRSRGSAGGPAAAICSHPVSAGLPGDSAVLSGFVATCIQNVATL